MNKEFTPSHAIESTEDSSPSKISFIVKASIAAALPLLIGVAALQFKSSDTQESKLNAAAKTCPLIAEKIAGGKKISHSEAIMMLDMCEDSARLQAQEAEDLEAAKASARRK